MRRPPVVALMGIDGSGKSTQAEVLARALTARGLPATAYRNAGGRLVLDRVARVLGVRDGPRLLGRAYVPYEALVRWTAVARGLLLARLRGHVAVMDRYAYCEYALFRARGDRGERWLRLAYRCFPAPDVACLLRLPVGLAQRRIDARGYDHEEGPHLAAFDAGYLSLPEAAAFRVVDASGDVASVHTALLEEVLDGLAGRGVLPTPAAPSPTAPPVPGRR